MAMVGHVGGRGRSGGWSGHRQGEIFPGLGACVVAGIMVGGLSAVILAGLLGPGDRSLLSQGTLGASLGGILGLFAGLGRAVWRPGPPLPAQEPAPARQEDPARQLWDPWLDSGRDIEWIGPEPEIVPVAVAEEPAVVEWGEDLVAERARVRPRVISPETGEAIPLEDEIGPMLQSGRCGLFAIAGGPGSGKTTALRHLAAILPPWAKDHVRLVDQRDAREGPDAPAGDWETLKAAADEFDASSVDANHHLVILAPRNSSPLNRKAAYRLAPWSKDDLIEYLLAAHWDRCASVMARLRPSDDLDFPSGIPELWTVVLDRMAGDESIGDVRTALRQELAERIGDRPALRERIEAFCLDAIHRDSNWVLNLPVDAAPGGVSAAVDLARLTRHRPTALLLAADRLAAIIETGRAKKLLLADEGTVPGRLLAAVVESVQAKKLRDHRFPRDLVCEAARRIAESTQARRNLQEWIGQDQCRAVHPLAASLLRATVPDWRPSSDCRPRLEGAYLDGVQWSGLNLEGVNLRGAELRDADLSAANLKKAHANRAQFQRANLHGAMLSQWQAEAADLSRADLRWVAADHARFLEANLAGASLLEANLWKADLRGANIKGADFTGANLEDAGLGGLTLRLARFDGARFGGATLSKCDLEEMELTNADFHDAYLYGALLTGSRMARANFVGANLRHAGLAEIDWPGACLRDADLRGANFHLGSSRGGLVGSPIACEGSRTGFYTDDYHDRDIKPPEEIRKANLRSADLRGADIKDVDFYLVDLRDAHYTEDQAAHFRHCRAILDDRIR
jgi:uncharacterized protein YjbI with pentapeptide repeats/energy-coupling factor transporter ATP-binding protein EcfA2